MRKDLKQLDELKMGDLWADASSRVPGPDPDIEPGTGRSPSSRVLAGLLALAIVGAAFGILWRAFPRTEPTIATEPDPASVCPSASHASPDYVDVGGTEVKTGVLQQAGVPWDQVTLVPASVLATFFTDTKARLSNAPREGWRPIVQEPERVEIAAPIPDAETWYHVSFAKNGNEWSLAGSGASEPVATSAQRGAGLRLEWHGAVTYDRHSPDGGIWLVNDRNTTWNDDRGEYYWAIVHLFDPATGQAIPLRYAVVGVGRSYSLTPAESVRLPLAFGDLTSVPDGQYEAIACVPDLALASEVGTVVLVSRTAASP